MRTTPIALMVLCAASAAQSTVNAAELDVQSRIDTVTVYPDGATVTRLIRVDLPRGDNVLRATDFPPGLDPASLRVEGEGSGAIVIGAVDARAPRAEPPPVPPEIERQVEALKDERATLDDRIEAATARKKFVERFADKSPAGLGEKGEARPITEWKTAFATVAEEIAAADTLIREARLRQREIDRALIRFEAEIKKDPPRKFEVRIDLAAEAATPATLRVSYSVRGARWVPLYDARLDTGTKSKAASLELVRRAEIVQQTGEDWSDVALSVSTVRTAKGGNAPELRPLVVRLLQPARPMAGASHSADYAQDKTEESRLALRFRGDSPAPAAPAVAKEREAEVDTGGYQAVFRIPGRNSVAANEGAKSFRVTTATIAPALLVRAAPALDQTAYLEASFKQADDAPLLSGRVSIYRDGIYVGRGQMALTPKDETVRLGFGADDKVKVTRTVTRKTAGSAGIILASKTDERDFKITVRNGHDTPVRVTVEDQLPISETEDVMVEMLSGSTPPTERDVRDRRGVMAWTFDAAPGEAREIKFGWRLRWPADRSVVYTPGT